MFYVYVLKYPGEGRFRAGVTEDPRKFGARRGQRESSRAASRDGSRLVFLEAYRERGPARLRSSELERRRLAFARLRKHGENRFDAARRRGAPAGTLSGCPAEIKRRAQNGQERINTAYYNITSGCNLKCRHCYAGNAEQGSVTAEENKRILSSLKKLGVESLVLLGGEPFCHPDLPGILAAAVEEGFDEIIIVTNGTLLPGGALDLIRRHGIKVRVSLDGSTERTNALTRPAGSFRGAYANLMKLHKAGVEVRVIPVMSSENIRHAYSFYRHFKSKKIPVSFSVIKDAGSGGVTKPGFEQVAGLMKKIFNAEKDPLKVFDIVDISDNLFFFRPGFPAAVCGGGVRCVTVSARGTVYPCVKLCEDGYKVGGLLEQGRREPLAAKRFPGASPDFLNTVSGCGNCGIRYFCGSGYKAEHFRTQKCFHRAGCPYRKSLREYFFKEILSAAGGV